MFDASSAFNFLLYAIRLGEVTFKQNLFTDVDHPADHDQLLDPVQAQNSGSSESHTAEYPSIEWIKTWPDTSRVSKSSKLREIAGALISGKKNLSDILPTALNYGFYNNNHTLHQIEYFINTRIFLILLILFTIILLYKFDY